MNKFILCMAVLFAVNMVCTDVYAANAQQTQKSGNAEFFIEPMDTQGWNLYLVTDTVARRISKATLKIYPIVSKDGNGAFVSKNGEQELEEAKRIAIISSLYSSRIRDYLSARVFDMSSAGWKNAAVFAGINPDTLEAKVRDNGNEALEKAYARATVLNVDSSSLFIDGKAYEGSPRVHSIFDAINESLPASRRIPLPEGYTPPAKKQIPSLYAVIPEGMKKNDQLIRIFDRYFEGIKAETPTYDSVREKFPWLDFLPSYILPATDDVKTAFGDFIAAGEFRFVPAAEEGGTGWVIYEDRNGNGYYPNKPARENTLELYIMSQCPYGVAAGNLLFGALKAGKLPENYKLELHFIGHASKDENGAWKFSSLHGENEWKEDARQLFVAKHYPEKLADYILERNKEITSQDWKKAAVAAGIDPTEMEKGEAESLELLAADFAIADALGIGSSPSFISEGRSFFVGMGHIYKLKGMEKLSGTNAANAVPAGSCN